MRKAVSNTTLIEQLFYFAFGISLEANDQMKKQKCVEKAYLDLCRTITYKKNASVNNKEDFKKEVNTIILESIDQYSEENGQPSEVFEQWHSETHKMIKEKAKVYEGIFEYQQGITVGQAQKWLNMTIKYLRIMGILPKQMEEAGAYIHIPIDNFILKAAKKNGIIAEGYNVVGLGVKPLSQPWSRLDNYIEYKRFQDDVRSELETIDCTPIDWETSAWLAVAVSQSKESDSI